MSGPDERISAYLLGELEPEEARAFERRLEGDPTLRGEVERLRPAVARLEALPAEVWEAPAPPPLALPEERRRAHRWRLPVLTLRPAAAAGLAALLLALGVAVGLLIEGAGGGAGPAPAATLAMSRIDDGPPGAHGNVRLAAGESRATVDVAGLDPSGAGRFYELWLLDEDGRMVALGSFRVGADGKAEVELPLPVAPQRYRYFDLSLQEDNGDPTHSGISVLRGPT
ncbi:MAG TPA: anti-sigma factor [Solirubrobacterales bacterium]|jgi:anti-sigma-K factor RskA